jgi:hypothetical protein
VQHGAGAEAAAPAAARPPHKPGLRSMLSADSGVDEILASGREDLPAAAADCFSDLDRELQRLIRLDLYMAPRPPASVGAGPAPEMGSSTGPPAAGAPSRVRAKRTPQSSAAGIGRGPAAALAPTPPPPPLHVAAKVAGLGAAAAPAGRAPKIVIKLPRSLASGGSSAGGSRGSGSGSGGAAGSAGLGPANAGVQKPRLTLKGFAAAPRGA